MAQGWRDPNRTNKLEDFLHERLVSAALMVYLERIRAGPSHSLHHGFRVALRTNEAGRELGLNDQNLRQLAVMSFFHDLYRSSQRISDEKGLARSIGALRSFCRAQKVSGSSANQMIEALKNPLTESPQARKLAAVLEYADFVEFLDRDRILSFIYENRVLRKMPVGEIEGVYLAKFGKKYQHLNPQARALVEEFVRRHTCGRTTDPMEIGREAFTLRYPNFSDFDFLRKGGSAPIPKGEARKIVRYLQYKDYQTLDSIASVLDKAVHMAIARGTVGTKEGLRIQRLLEKIKYYRNFVDELHAHRKEKGAMPLKKRGREWVGIYGVRAGKRFKWPPRTARQTYIR